MFIYTRAPKTTCYHDKSICSDNMLFCVHIYTSNIMFHKWSFFRTQHLVHTYTRTTLYFTINLVLRTRCLTNVNISKPNNCKKLNSQGNKSHEQILYNYTDVL